MSYSRIGEDSDVYVWADNVYIWVQVSQLLTMTDSTLPVGVQRPLHHRTGQMLMFTDRQEAYSVLSDMCAEGVNVPGYVFTRLYDEMTSLGRQVGGTGRGAS